MMKALSQPKARYLQIKEYVEEHIRSGLWKSGDMIPSEMQLTEHFKLSRMTVNRALRELTQEGKLERVSGVGTFVSVRKPQSTLIMINNLADEIRSRGHRYHCQLVSLGKVSAPFQIASAMNLATGTSVAHLRCVHFEEGLAVQTEDRYVNSLIVPEFHTQTFTDDFLPAEYLLQTIPATEIEHIVDAETPTAEEIELLQIPEHEPCLTLTRRTWNEQKQVVTYARFVHPASRYRLGSRFSLTEQNRSS